jgi:uncharacterized MAPEG superfamily protein
MSLPALLVPFAIVPIPVVPARAGDAFAGSLVLSAALVVISMIPLGLARAKTFTPADLKAPREMFDRLPAWGKRATWAHQNFFESFILHAPACLLCLVMAAPVVSAAPWTVTAAWLHPLLRLGYLGAYLGNVAPLRSLCWIGALLCSGVLYGEGLRALLRG